MERFGNRITNNIAFKAGYGDPYRTIAKKMNDYVAIEDESKQYATKNEMILTAINEMKAQVISLGTLIKNVSGVDVKAMKAKIAELNQKIQKKEEEFQYNRDMITNLYYSYYER